MKASSEDFERDGIKDRWNITLRVRKPYKGAQLSGLNLVLDFDYQTQSTIKMRMDTVAIVSMDFP